MKTKQRRRARASRVRTQPSLKGKKLPVHPANRGRANAGSDSFRDFPIVGIELEVQQRQLQETQLDLECSRDQYATLSGGQRVQWVSLTR